MIRDAFVAAAFTSKFDRSTDRAVETGDWRAAAPSFFSLGPLLKKGVLRVDRWTDHILKRAHLIPLLVLLILLRRV